MARNEYGKIGRKAVVQDIRGISDAYRRFDELVSSAEFLALMSEMTGIADLQYDPEYVGGGTHENLSGQALDVHVDFNYQPRTKSHRRLNLILFLNEEWREDWGGLLELHRDPWIPPEENEIRTVTPVQNRCVVFETSERSWHGFEAVADVDGAELSRKTLAIYLYTRDRPEDEIVPEHGTIYVKRPLPPELKAGHTLTDADVTRVRKLITGRDDYLRRMYERELVFSSEMGRMGDEREELQTRLDQVDAQRAGAEAEVARLEEARAEADAEVARLEEARVEAEAEVARLEAEAAARLSARARAAMRRVRGRLRRSH
jgi:hypothetical protein